MEIGSYMQIKLFKIYSTEKLAVYIVDKCLIHIQHTVEDITVQKTFW